jgi:hypothetical protein
LVHVGGGFVSVLALGIACVFEVSRAAVGAYDGGEGGGGGYEEGFHGECELAEAVKTGIGAVDDCSALKNMLARCILRLMAVGASEGTLVLLRGSSGRELEEVLLEAANVLTTINPIVPPVIPPLRVAL